MIRPTPCAPRPARLRPLALALLTATSLTGCEFTQSLFRGRSAIPEAPLHPQFGAPLVKPPSIVATQPTGAPPAPAPLVNAPPLNAPPPGAELLRTPAGRHIAVLPIEGAPQDRGYVIREALAGALGVRIDQNAFAAAPQSYRLECRAFLEGGALLLEWRLMDSVGRTLDVVFERQAFTGRPGLDPWSALSDEALSAVGRRSAERLAREMAASNLVLAPRGAAPAAPAAAILPARPAAPIAAPAPATAGLAFGGGADQPSGVSFAPMPTPPPLPAPRPAAPAPIAAPPPIQAPMAQTAPGPSFSLGAAPPPRSLAAPTPMPAPAPSAPAPSYQPPPPPPAPALAPSAAPAPAGAFGAPTNSAAVAATAPIAFRGVFGAPGDGDRSLSAALRALLTQAGERLVPEGTPGAMVLAGQVEKRSGASGDVISITWRLEDPFGGGVGQVLQENEVPRGALDGAWGEDAGYAAEGALDGVNQLIAAARKGPA